MMIRKMVVGAAASACVMGISRPVVAQVDARVAYQQRQAVQEVQRLSSQFDQMQSGMESLSARIGRLEGSNATGDLRAELSALRSDLNELKRRQEAMRGEIVAEISRKMADLIAKTRPAPPPPAPRASSASREREAPAAATGPTGPYFEHTIEPGETLSYIAKECNTTVQKIKLYNNMKDDNLRVGRVLKIPAEETKKK